MEATTTRVIPRSVLFGNPERQSPQISPDGTHIAYLAPLEGVMNVWIESIDGELPRAVTNVTGRGIPAFVWTGGGSRIIYLRDRDGDENWHLHVVDLADGSARDLTPFEGALARITGMDKKFPNTLVLAINKNDPRLFDAYRADTTTGELEQVTTNPGNVMGWISDRQLRVRGAITTLPSGGGQLLVRDDEQSEFRVITEWDADDFVTSHPLGFSGDGNSVYALDSRGANTGRLVSISVADASVTVIAEDPVYDVNDAVFDHDTHRPLMVAFSRARREWQVIDESVRKDVENIAAIGDGDFDIINRDYQQRRWIVAFASGHEPSVYYLYDGNDGSSRLLFKSRPDLDGYKLAEVEPFSFIARDGLEIHGYVTFPPDSDRKNLPLILNVHGGPASRNHWSFHPEVQWMANRGYICMQVNYRGSTGYGKDFINKGNREWAGKMHDDLIDAVNWAVECGYANPDRLAIYGGSYGGFAALVGATFTPDTFRCAVSIVGPSSLLTLIRSIPPYWTPIVSSLKRKIGDPDTEPEFLLARSPLTHVDRIRIPMLICQGANDPRVKQAESEQIVAAMRDRGIDHEYMLFEDEGHGLARPENRMKFYAVAERFLAEHLGGRVEQTVSENGVAA